MRTAVLSDVHGNLEAITAVLKDIDNEGIKEILFLGDIIGYGANPNECIDLLRNCTKVMVAGNHDFGAVSMTDINRFNPSAREAVLWSKDNLRSENLEFLSRLKLIAEYNNFTLVHSSPFLPEKWNYILDEETAMRHIKHCHSRFCFVGHSHRPFIFEKENKNKLCHIHMRVEKDFKIKGNCQYIINVGSVGQPRDGNPDSAYIIIDIPNGLITIKRVPYDIKSAQKRIILAKLPVSLAQRLSNGR